MVSLKSELDEDLLRNDGVAAVQAFPVELRLDD
jgi:hypothetical protein